MAILFKEGSIKYDSNGGNFNVTKPASLANGDVLIASVIGGTSDGAITPPSGWNTRSTNLWLSSTRRCGIYWKYITNAAGEGTTYTFNSTTPSASSLIVATYSGVDGVDPFAVTTDSYLASSNSTSATGNFSTNTTTTDGAVIILCCWANATSSSITIGPQFMPPNTSMRVSPAGTALRHYFYDMPQTTAGTINPISLSGAAEYKSGYITALKPLVVVQQEETPTTSNFQSFIVGQF